MTPDSQPEKIYYLITGEEIDYIRKKIQRLIDGEPIELTFKRVCSRPAKESSDVLDEFETWIVNQYEEYCDFILISRLEDKIVELRQKEREQRCQ